MTHFGVQLHGTFPMHQYPGLARAVESYAFDELTVHDIVWWRPVWPILALVAEHTERVLVGPDVTHPYLRHPADTAACLAGIDELSGGRAILGLGAGSMLDPLGLAATRPRTAVRETAELIRRLLARDRAAYEGELFSADPQAQFFWEPARPRVPIFVGTLGPRMVAEAALWADELRPAGIFAPGFFRDLQRRARETAGWEGYPVGCEVRSGAGSWRSSWRCGSSNRRSPSSRWTRKRCAVWERRWPRETSTVLRGGSPTGRLTPSSRAGTPETSLPAWKSCSTRGHRRSPSLDGSDPIPSVRSSC